MAEDTDIAIVGIGGRFPGANNINEYWRVLSHGENHVIEIPRSRWNIDAFYDPDPNVPGKTYVRRAGFVDGVEEWDHRFFGVNDAEAELVDPQQRMVLECVHMALEDGGITRKDIQGSQTAVYIGVMTDDYKGHAIGYENVSSAYSVTGTHPSIISARVSYVYNLSGPAMTIDTACSSSLVAINLASEALLSGSCTGAICGGVNVLLDPQLFIALSKARMLSPTGQCQTFTKFADGYARGEGCGIVILKRLKDALRDGNKIWATVKTGTNQDGHSVTPITAPSSKQQLRLLNEVYAKHHIDKTEIQVIEAHGTGTPIGDPTEATALGTFFGRNADKKTHIGSVKTNIGHLEAAAGVAGLIKVLLMMKHKQIVPSLWYTKDNENPKLHLQQYGFVVPTACINWALPDRQKQTACVNSFGFGGTNAHAIVQEYVQAKDTHPLAIPFENGIFPVVVISAFDQDTLVRNAKSLSDSLGKTNYDLFSLSCTSTCKRDHLPKRKAFVARSQSNLIDICTDFTRSKPSVNSLLPDKNIVFVFCGVGTVWEGMCKWLLTNRTFENAIDGVDSHLQTLTGWTIKSKLKDTVSTISSNPMVSHIAIFACQVGLAALWKHFGVEPDLVIGQSVGEVAAAYVAGVLDLQSAVRTIFYRSKFLANVTNGTMAVVRHIDVADVDTFCKTSRSLSVAVFSSPVSCTVSGEKSELLKLQKYTTHLTHGRAETIFLDVNCAYHSSYVENAAKSFAESLGKIPTSNGTIPMYSTVTGQAEANKVLSSKNYWERNIRRPVLFAKAVKNAQKDKNHNIYLEIGPSPVLRAHIRDIFSDQDNISVVASVKKQDEAYTLAQATCQLYEHGLHLEWNHIVPCRKERTDAPTCQLRKFKRLYQRPNALLLLQGIPTNLPSVHPYVKKMPNSDGRFEFTAEVNEQSTPFVYEHIVRGHNILPGAFYADVGYMVGCSRFGVKKQNVSLEFLRPVKIEKHQRTLLSVSTYEQDQGVLFHVKHNQTVSCKGFVTVTKGRQVPMSRINVESLKVAITLFPHHSFMKEEIYDQLRAFGFIYGDRFQLIRKALSNGTYSVSEIEIPPDIMDNAQDMYFHPCILDAMMQTTILTITSYFVETLKEEYLSFLPVAMEEIHCFKKPEAEMVIHTKLVNATVLDTVFQFHCNILMMDQQGNRIAEVINYTTYSKRTTAHAPCELRYEITWQPIAVNSEVTHDSEIFLISRDIPEAYSKLLREYDSVTVYKDSGKDIQSDEYISNAFSFLHETRKTAQLGAIVLFVKGTSVSTDISEATALSLYETAADNCMLVTDLLKYNTDRNSRIPLYIVTENTQSTFQYQGPQVSIVGPELWGFIRSVYLEFIHGDVTLIDLQSSFSASKKQLIDFIAKSCNHIEETPTEIIIYEDKIFESNFSKVSKSKQTPVERSAKPTFSKLQGPFRILSTHARKIEQIHIAPIPIDIDVNRERKHSNLVGIRIKTVTIPPDFIHLPSVSARQMNQGIWSGNMEWGHPIYAVEYTGYVMGSKGKNIFACKGSVDSSDGDISGKWESVVVHPATAYTEMFVPKACVVHIKDLPFYMPGLLLYSLVFWKMTEIIPMKATVIILGLTSKGKAHALLEAMLKHRKQATVRYLVQSSDIEEIDVAIAMGNLSDEVDLLSKSKMVVSLPGCISTDLAAALEQAKKGMTCVIDTDKIFQDRYLKSEFTNVIRWLKSNKKVLLETICQQEQKVAKYVFHDQCQIIQVLNDGGLNQLPMRKALNQMFCKSAKYVVTGGLTGLGWEICMLLAEMGAGTIATVSRRTVTQTSQDSINELSRRTGCKIVSVQGNVSDAASMRQAFCEIKSIDEKPVRGIFHCAGVSEPVLLMNLQRPDLEYVLKPKILGTMNLHVLCNEMKMKLDFFVVASSISSVIGSPGQSNYGAANSFMDTFISWRRSVSLAGQTINWGALSIGMASRKKFLDNFKTRGFNLMPVEEIRVCFQEALLQNSTGTVYADINWDICANNYGSGHTKRLQKQMSLLIEQESSLLLKQMNDDFDLKFDTDMLSKDELGKQLTVLTRLVHSVASKVIGGDVGQVKSEQSIAELGFDSMSTVTFINLAQKLTGYRLPNAFMIDSSHTLSDITQHIQDHIYGDLRTESSHK